MKNALLSAVSLPSTILTYTLKKSQMKKGSFIVITISFSAAAAAAASGTARTNNTKQKATCS
jgi:hypothetical protein